MCVDDLMSLQIIQHCVPAYYEQPHSNIPTVTGIFYVTWPAVVLLNSYSKVFMKMSTLNNRGELVESKLLHYTESNLKKWKKEVIPSTCNAAGLQATCTSLPISYWHVRTYFVSIISLALYTISYVPSKIILLYFYFWRCNCSDLFIFWGWNWTNLFG